MRAEGSAGEPAQEFALVFEENTEPSPLPTFPGPPQDAITMQNPCRLFPSSSCTQDNVQLPQHHDTVDDQGLKSVIISRIQEMKEPNNNCSGHPDSLNGTPEAEIAFKPKSDGNVHSRAYRSHPEICFTPNKNGGITYSLSHEPKQDGERPNVSSPFQNPAAGDGAIMNPSTQLVTRLPPRDVGDNTGSKSQSPMLHGLDNLGEIECNNIEVSSIISKDERETEKVRRKATGPRPKSAKEWFAKKPQDTRAAIPKPTDLKRKRSKDDNRAEISLPRRQKRSKKATVNNGKKKSHRNAKPQKSIKVMAATLESLKYADPIEARIALGNIPEVDPILTKTKKSQFLQMMKNSSGHADKRQVAADKNKLQEATCSFGYGKCVAKDGKWLISGMNTALLNHQVVGASWMLGREFSEEGPRGGILADEMGMGKTLQSLACIVSNRPTDLDPQECSPLTLIVAPASAIQQWYDEILKHADKRSFGGVIHYKGIKSLDLEVLLDLKERIILASYHEVARQYPTKKIQGNPDSHHASAERFKGKYNDSPGPLFGVSFWRIILDEAQNIKNKHSQVSIACQNLTGRYRWGISGTPITNSLDELYPYLEFLKAGSVHNPKEFHYLYGNPADEEATERLAYLTSSIMLRRTMADRFMGEPLYKTPLCHITVRRVRLTKEERAIYDVVQCRFRENINNILKRVQARRRRVQFRDLRIHLVYLLRLRQGAAHPFLLEDVLTKTLNKEDLLEIQKRLREAGSEKPLFKQIGSWCANQANMIKGTTADDSRNAQNTFGKSRFGYEFDMEKQMNIALASKSQDVCQLCYLKPTNRYAGQCGHPFCRGCLDDYLRVELRDGNLVPKCPECEDLLDNYELLDPSDEEYSDIENSMRVKRTRRIRKLGRDDLKQHPKLRKSQSRFLQQCDQTHPKPVVPSAKTMAVKDAIVKWQAEAPDDKIIVFMEFKMTGAILGRMLKAEGIRFLYFFGDLSQLAKQNAIRKFQEKKEIKVMLTSMRCGSVALNLTCANRVILVDLWWNIPIERQAFGRVFRIGQTKETHFLRIIAENTVDNRIEAIQEKKVKDTKIVLGQEDLSRLSVEDVASFFGRVTKSGDGFIEIMPDVESGDESDESDESDEAEEVDEAGVV